MLGPPTSEEHTIPGVTCQALYSPSFIYNFHHFLNVSDRNHITFKFNYAILVLTNIFVLKIILQVLHDIKHTPFLFVTYCLPSICLLLLFHFCDISPEMSRFPIRHHHHHSSSKHSSLLFGLITHHLRQPWRHPAIRRFLATKASALSSLTICAQFAQKTSSHHRALPVTLPVLHIVATPGLVFPMVCL